MLWMWCSFVLGIIGVLIWQFMQRRKGGGGLGSGGAQLSQEDEDMLSDILRKQNHFAPTASGRSRRLTSTRSSSSCLTFPLTNAVCRRTYEQRSYSVSQSDDDDDDDGCMRENESESDHGEGVGFGIDDDADDGEGQWRAYAAGIRQRKLEQADDEGVEATASAIGNREKHD